jgi:CubicO group peptidase (beta-lactamase class C family)
VSDVQGWTATGFEGVRDAFAHNLHRGADVGAGFAAYHRGAKVVDLWGGVADVATGSAWEEDTLVLVFSTTKGATAVCANVLAQDGALDLSAPVAEVWPEFAAEGKHEVTVAHLLAHEAGLPWVDGAMTLEEALAWTPVVDALAAQAPVWEPGTRHGYHATTFGWLVGEVVRRAAGAGIGAVLRERVADPLGLDLWIGLPEAEEHRVAPLIPFGAALPRGDAEGADGAATDEPGGERPARRRSDAAEIFRKVMGPDTDLGRTLAAPGGALGGRDIWNTRAVRAAEIPAANGVTDARSVARMYAACLGEVDGVRLLGPDQLSAATTRRTDGPDTLLFGMDIQFGLGFMVHSSLLTLGGPTSFGHFGMGGSVGWADPAADLAVGYVMNRMDLNMTGDSRSADLIAACYRALG